VIETKNNQASKTLRFLDRRIKELSADLSGIEGGLQSFKENNRITEFEADAEYNLTMKGELSKRLMEAESQLELARMARDFIAAPGNEYELIPFTSSDESATGVNALISAYNGVAIRRMQVMNGATEENLQVKNLGKGSST